MTTLIAALPNGRWPPSEAGIIAARLVELLPSRRGADSALGPAASDSRPTSVQLMVIALSIAVISGMMFFAISSHVIPANPTELAAPTSPSAPPPGTP